MGVLVHQSMQKMNTPNPGANYHFFDQPINVQAALGIANPGQQPRQSFQTGEMTQPEFMPANRDQNALLDGIQSALASQTKHYQMEMWKYWLNGGDHITIPNQQNISPILTHHSEPHSAVYWAQRNQKSRNASAHLMGTRTGSQMGAANWAK